jgi:hypothetical protein
MTAMEPLCQLIDIHPNNLSHEENLIVEAELFTRICEELKEIIRAYYRDYFHLMKFNQLMENTMIEANFIRCVINDILATEEYSLSGIACYTDTPEDVIHEVIAGNNHNPSWLFSRKIIELHRSVRPEIYQAIMKKITANYLQ